MTLNEPPSIKAAAIVLEYARNGRAAARPVL